MSLKSVTILGSYMSKLFSSVQTDGGF